MKALCKIFACSFFIAFLTGCFFAEPEDESQEVSCPQCYGTGKWNIMPGDVMAYVDCPLCSGTGIVDEQMAMGYIQFQTTQNASTGYSNHYYQGSSSVSSETQCPICFGKGTCRFCAGRGWKSYNDNIIVDCDQCHGSGRCADCFGKGSI